MNNEYLKEDQMLFSSILERNYFNIFRNGNKNGKGIELFINGLCSANCSYCYLKKHQKELFPASLYNIDKILTNTKQILKWYIDNKFCCNLDIFSGELFTTELGFKLLDVLYETFNKKDLKFKPPIILFPDNMNFIRSKEITDKIQVYINQFKQININIQFSASIDGAKCDFGRTEQDDQFYKNCFNFLDKNNYYCHPMISSQNIEYWIENYLWWVQNAPPQITKRLMMLEVRDETWTNQSIMKLNEFCNFLIDFKLQNYFNNNLIDFTKYVFRMSYQEMPYSPEFITCASYFNNNHDHCSFKDEIIIRVADLALCLCHRLSYPHLILGHFNNQNEIIMNQNTVPLLLTKTSAHKYCLPYCETCIFEPICPGYCLGNSYENYQNILIPTKQVCNLYQNKNVFLIKKYDSMGLFDILEHDLKNNIDDTALLYLIELKNKINMVS